MAQHDGASLRLKGGKKGQQAYDRYLVLHFRFVASCKAYNHQFYPDLACTWLSVHVSDAASYIQLQRLSKRSCQIASVTPAADGGEGAQWKSPA